MVNFDLVIKRIEDLKGVRGDKHVAAILGLSPQDFSNRKKRGSLLPAVFEWAINESVNLDWLIKGQNETEQPAPMMIVAEEGPNYIKGSIVKRINTMLMDMDEKAQRDVLKYTEEKKLLAELMAEKQRKAG